MKQEKTSPPRRVAAYCRVATVQQLFSSNAEMARHYFKKRLEDGKEHSINEGMSMELNGVLLSRDTAIAEIRHGEIVTANQRLLPLYLLHRGDLLGWLRSRGIDRRRTNARILLKALRLSGCDDAELVLKVHGAAITTAIGTIPTRKVPSPITTFISSEMPLTNWPCTATRTASTSRMNLRPS